MRNKKAQAQMLETVAVIFIFFLLILMGLMFYVRVYQANAVQDRLEQFQRESITIAQRASFLPELQCSEENIVKDNCVDILKLEAAQAIIQNNEIHYYDKLLFSRVEVTEIYPTSGRTWQLYDRALDDFTQKAVTNIPISLYDPITDTNGFGIMTVELFIS